jgi:hypothetical protein
MLPGAREDLVDLGRFWDSSKLFGARDTLEALLRKKKLCFARAYSYLGAYGRLDEVKQRIISEHLDREKISATASKLVCEIEDDMPSGSKTRIVSAIGKDGRVDFDTYEKSADRVVRIDDSDGAAHLLLEGVEREAKRFNRPISVSYDPLFFKRPNALRIGKTVLVATHSPDAESTQGYLRVGSSVDAERILRINEMQKALLDEAVGEFSSAAQVHFGIEEIYIDAMNFSLKEEFTRDFIEKLKK